jgi:DNA-binding NarL/FixJ family response regulator
MLLQEEPGLIVSGDAADSEELLANVAVIQPDTVLLDWELPGEPVKVLLSTLRAQDGQLRVIVLSGRPELKAAALAAGADAFASKINPPKELVAAIFALEQDGLGVRQAPRHDKS